VDGVRGCVPAASPLQWHSPQSGRGGRLLSGIFQCAVRRSDAAASILTDFYMFVLVFARERAFSDVKVSTLLSIAHDVVTTDAGAPLRTARDSFAHLADLIRLHACERSPYRWVCLSLSVCVCVCVCVCV
jgi:Flagellar C1a complex subunit C1a-32